MKSFFIFILSLLSIITGVQAQGQYGNIVPTYIEPFRIEVSLNKTTNLLFHFPVRHVDRGSDEILDSLCNDTALLLKAGSPNFKPTNLSVYTADGRLYSFLVGYNADPAHLNMVVRLSDSLNAVARDGVADIQTADAFEAYCSKVAAQPSLWSGHRAKEFGVSIRLKGLYVHRNILLLALELANKTGIRYDVSSLRFSISDSKKAKRTATQELEIQPSYTSGDASVIEPESKRLIVIAIPKFTLPYRKKFRISMAEQDGGRNPTLHFTNRTIEKAHLLP